MNNQLLSRCNMVRTLICLVCPRGCRLTIDKEGKITGNQCARGIPYAKQELSNPKRTVSYALKIAGSNVRVPVKTDKPIAKSLIEPLSEYLKDFEAKLPIKFHDVLIKNVLDTDVNIIATKSFEKV